MRFPSSSSPFVFVFSLFLSLWTPTDAFRGPSPAGGVAWTFPKYQAERCERYFTCPILTRESIFQVDRIPTPRAATQQQQQQRSSADVHLVDVDWLKPHEEIVGEHHVSELLKATLRWGAYVAPLLVDRVTGAILDGHHRYHVAMRLGLSRVPAVLVDYEADDGIDVDVWEDCGRRHLTKRDVLTMACGPHVFPPKTSKHRFSDSLPNVLVPLALLQPQQQQTQQTQQTSFLQHAATTFLPRPHGVVSSHALDYHI